MNAKDLDSFKKYLASKVEPDLISILKKYHQNFISVKSIKSFPQVYRDISLLQNDDEIIKVNYPKCKKNDYSKLSGMEVCYFDIADGAYVYLGNISFSLEFKKNKNSFDLIGYSYKYWLANNSYILCTENEQLINKINFNLRFDWDLNHESEGLEYHVNVLHTRPRIHSRFFSINDFIKYLEDNIFPLSKRSNKWYL